MFAYHIDPDHSSIEFSVRHMMISKVRGSFGKFSGTIDLDEEHPENTTVEVHIDGASIDTASADRDAHLRSPDFLYVEKYPDIIFKSKRVEVQDPEHARLVGDLTIQDKTNEVVLDVIFNGKAVSPWGTTSYGFEGHTTINRADWGLTWNKALETGGWLVGDSVNVDISLELVKQEQEAEELAQEEAKSMEQSR